MFNNNSNQTLRGFFAKISFYSIAGLIICSIVLAVISMNKINQITKDTIETKVFAVASSAARLMDGDYIQSLQQGDESEPEYVSVLNTLRKIQKDNEITYLYVIGKFDGDVVFLIDTDDEETVFIGEEYISNPEIESAFSGMSVVAAEYVVDEWGKFKTAYAPVLNSAGKVVAVMCADYDATLLESGIKSYIMFFIIIDLLIVFVVSSFVLVGGFLSYSKIKRKISGASANLKGFSNVLMNITEMNIEHSSILARNNSSIAAAVEEMAATMNETAAIIQKNDENTKNAAEFFREVNNQLNESSAKMNNLANSINVIQSTSLDANEVISSSRTLAKQTTILALNANVEAARVGELGMGFSEIAKEVGALAQSSENSARSSAEIIGRNIDDIQTAARDSTITLETLESVNNKINNLSTIVDEIKIASSEQTLSAANLAKAIALIDDTINKTAELSDETKEAAETIGNTARDIDVQIDSLRRIIDEK